MPEPSVAATPAEAVAVPEARGPMVPLAVRVMLARGGLIALGFVVWEVLVASGQLNPFFFGRPSLIWRMIVTEFGSGRLLSHTWVTLSETLLGFVLGMVLGSLFGLSLWWSRFWASVLEPLLLILNATPKIALAPIFVVWVGVSFWMKVSLAFTVVVVVAGIVAYDGTKQVDRDLERLLYSLGASKAQVFAKLVVPSCLPWIFSALRMCIGFALLGAVVGEFISSTRGLGYLILYGSSIYELNLVWTALFSLMVLSTLLHVAGGRLERALMRHKHEQRRTA